MRRTLVVAMLLSLAGALAPSCSAPGLPLTVEYLVEWDRAGVTPLDDGTWTTTTDEGFEVRVLEGSLTSYATTLVPCSEGDAFAVLALAPAIARAGHVENADASQIEPQRVEAIAPADPLSLGEVVARDAPRYCSAHWVVAGGVRLDGESPVREPSLTIAFEARDAAGVLVRTGSLSTTVATGVLADIDAPSAGSAIAVTFVRPLSTLFDGIDLADPALEDADVARSLLLQLARSTRVVTHERSSGT